jgi:hypothetical protein
MEPADEAPYRAAKATDGLDGMLNNYIRELIERLLDHKTSPPKAELAWTALGCIPTDLLVVGRVLVAADAEQWRRIRVVAQHMTPPVRFKFTTHGEGETRRYFVSSVGRVPPKAGG